MLRSSCLHYITISTEYRVLVACFIWNCRINAVRVGDDKEEEKSKKKKAYNTGDSPVVTDPTTSPALSGLTRGERTGSRAFQMVWSYVMGSFAMRG